MQPARSYCFNQCKKQSVAGVGFDAFRFRVEPVAPDVRALRSGLTHGGNSPVTAKPLLCGGYIGMADHKPIGKPVFTII